MQTLFKIYTLDHFLLEHFIYLQGLCTVLWLLVEKILNVMQPFSVTFGPIKWINKSTITYLLILLTASERQSKQKISAGIQVVKFFQVGKRRKCIKLNANLALFYYTVSTFLALSLNALYSQGLRSTLCIELVFKSILARRFIKRAIV